MATRKDIHKVLIIGSGPIVIGQACEFDYSGTQACKALRACGYEIVLVNSNPATIMTDPVMADATYIEPLNPRADHRQGAPRRAPAEPRRPDGPQPLDGAREEGRPRQVRREGDRRQPRRDRARRGPRGLQGDDGRARHRDAQERHRPQRRGRREAREGADRLPGRRPPRLHDGRRRRRLLLQRRGAAHDLRPRPRRLAHAPVPHRGKHPQLGGARGRGRPRREEPDDRGLLHREHRRRGRPHGRLLLRRAVPHDRQEARGAPPPRRLPHRREDRRHRRHQRPVRARPEDGPRGDHRDQPAHLALVRARLEGDGLPDRARLRQARGGSRAA